MRPGVGNRESVATPADGRGPVAAEIDPRLVRHHYIRRTHWEKLRFAVARLRYPSMVQGGGWDLRVGPCEYHSTYQMLAELHAADFALESTSIYQRLQQAAHDGKPLRKDGRVLADAAAIEGFFDEHIDLFKRMWHEGYRPGLGKDEPGIAIGRHGQIIKVANGNHRFAIARLLGLAPIPVEVHYIHPHWHAATPLGSARLRRSVERALEAARLQPASQVVDDRDDAQSLAMEVSRAAESMSR